MKIIGVIPARMNSSRFPGKPLAKIKGISMLEHVVNGCRNSTLDRLVVATPDDEIRNAMEAISVEVIMTSPLHERASDRTQEAVEYLEKNEGIIFDIVVMIQGDEPMIKPHMISAAIEPVQMGMYRVSNIMQEMVEEEWQDPSEVKVVVNLKSEAIYFSREPIPSVKKGNTNFRKFKQVCIIPFERKMLDDYSNMEQTPLEIIESVDMLRLIENDIPIKMILTEDITYSVDTIEDLNKVSNLV